jgi:hypothetical protein
MRGVRLRIRSLWSRLGYARRKTEPRPKEAEETT